MDKSLHGLNRALHEIRCHMVTAELKLSSLQDRVYFVQHTCVPAFPKDIMMSAVPARRRVKVRGVTSLHTLKARTKASSITELSMSGE